MADELLTVQSMRREFLNRWASREGLASIPRPPSGAQHLAVFFAPTSCQMLSQRTIVGLALVAPTAYGRLSLHKPAAMPYLHKKFTVTVTRRQSATPIVSTYRTKEEAMQAANGFRSMLFPKDGGQVIVHDPDGKELQTWIEHAMGAHFTNHGGFQI